MGVQECRRLPCGLWCPERRKRHLLVDTEVLVLEVRVHSSRVPDEDGIRLLLGQVVNRLPRLSHLWVDAGYQGRGRRWVQEVLGLSVEVVRKPQKPARGFKVLPRRWVVDRTFSWLSQNRRMSKDYERLPQSSEAFVYVAITRLMARRLARV